MPSLKDLKIRIASVKSTRKITKAMQMVAAAKLRRAQEAAEAARPYAERMEVGARQPRGRRRGQPLGAAPADRDRQVGRASAGGRHRRARPVRRLQLVDRQARADACRPARRRGQDRQDPHRRQEGPRAAAPRPRPRAGRACRSRRGQARRLLRRVRDRAGGADPLRRRRVRRLHAVLQPLPVGDQPDPDRAPADPGRRSSRARRRGRSTNTSPTRRRSSPTCCRAASRRRCSPRCSRTAPPNRARG